MATTARCLAFLPRFYHVYPTPMAILARSGPIFRRRRRAVRTPPRCDGGITGSLTGWWDCSLKAMRAMRKTTKHLFDNKCEECHGTLVSLLLCKIVDFCKVYWSPRFVCLSVCVSVCLSVCVSVCLFVCLSVCSRCTGHTTGPIFLIF